MRKCIIMMFIVVGLSMAQNSKFAVSSGGLYRDEAQEIVRTSDNGYALAGMTDSYGAGGYDLILSRFDDLGQHLWTRVIGGTANEQTPVSLVETNDDGLVIVGTTNSYGAGDYDIFLVKFDASGNFLWAKTIGGASYDDARHIIQTEDGGFVMTGITYSFVSNRSDQFTVKLDALANLSWATSISYWDEYGNSIVQTLDKGYVLTGGSWGFGSNDLCPIISKLDSLGICLWTRQISPGEYIGTNVSSANAIAKQSNGNFYVGGYTEQFNSAGAEDCFLSKFNAAGTHLWTRSWGGSNNEEVSSIVMTPDERIVTVGYTESYGAGSRDIFLNMFDTSGTHLWSRTIGGANLDYGNSLTRASDDGFAIAGYTKSFGVDSIDMILVKFDSLGMTCIGDTITPVIGSPSPGIGTSGPNITYSTPTVHDTIPDISNITPSIHVICESMLPDNFDLLSPADSTTLEIARPTFVWNASYDTLSGIKNYEVYICDTLRTTCTDTFWTADYNLQENYNDWYVIAYDNFDNSRQSNQTWTVFIDTSGPFIDSTTIWEDTPYSGPFPVYTNVTGLNDIDVVRLYYRRLEDPSWFFRNMNEGTGTWYYDEIPIASQNNDTIKYYIYAADTLPDEATDPADAPSSYYSFVARMVSGIEENNGIPKNFSLSVNSLAKDRAIFGFSLPGEARISLVVYDVTGRSIWELNSVEYSPGYYELPFVPRRKGVYFYEFSSPYKDEKGKLVIF